MEGTQYESLYIPMGLKAESEIFTGFGKPELMKSLAGIVAAAIIATILYITLNNIETVIVFMLVAVSASIGIFIKDSTGNSMAIQMSNMTRFLRSQKKYRYIQMDEWERK